MSIGNRLVCYVIELSEGEWLSVEHFMTNDVAQARRFNSARAARISLTGTRRHYDFPDARVRTVKL